MKASCLRGSSTKAPPMSKAKLALILASLALPLCGCVVDEARTEALREEREAAPPTLPSDPIASPVMQGTTASRVSVAIEALGSVSYDGIQVPLVSPDGRFIAAQDAPAPPRATRFATSVEGDVAGSRNATVSISPLNADVIGFRPRAEVFDLEAPILLGRDSNLEGVLIESPRPDGSRWIGVAEWSERDARVRWIVQDQSVSAHAVFGPSDGLLYSRRRVGESRFELVLRDRDNQERTISLPDASLVYPLMAPDLEHATCLAVRPSGAISLLLIDLTASSGDSLGRVLRRFDLAASGGMAGAAQIVAASQSAILGVGTGDAMSSSRGLDTAPPLGPIFFHPAMDRCAAVDTARRTLVALAPKSVAAVDAGDGRALCSTPEGLVLWTPGPQAGRGTATRVLSEDYLPRRTASTDRAFVLFAPVRRSATELSVFGMVPAEAP